MVSLKSELCEETLDERDLLKARRRRAARARSRKRDNLWFVATTIAIVFFVIGCAVSSFRSSIDEAYSQMSATPRFAEVTVKQGDTLWTYAHRYSAPGSYILDSVDSIARDNGINSRESLTPGQKLKIRVENPVVLAALERNSRVASAE